ncbi:hypothetical protein KGP36_02995 [Patescibacteria group bacterium]|nr:hypothetical protein [Patescibacteria group bacterium]
MTVSVTVDQAKLVLNAFAATFQNNLVAADAVTWKQFDGEMNDRNALTVTEQVGPRYTVTQTTNGVADLTSGVQSTVFGSEQFTINKTFGASMGWGDFLKIQSIGEARESEALRNAATNLAEQIDAYIMRTAVLAGQHWLGNPANGINTWDDYAQAYTRLKELGAGDEDLRSILTYKDRETLGAYILGLRSDSLVDGAFRKGFEGQIDGTPVMFSQQLPILTTGTRTSTAAVHGAGQNVNYSAVAVSPAPGRYLTQTLILNGLGANATIKAGENFNIAGVYGYDNRAQANNDWLQEFVVVADATADGTGQATVTIFPAIIVPGTADGTGTTTVNTANATVSAAPADTAVVTFTGNPSSSYRARAYMQKSAIVVNTVPLITPATGKALSKSLTKVPLSVRMWQWSNFQTGEHDVRFDVALTANIRDRRRIIRVNGN